jgi:flavin prenyltransferase
VTAENRPSLLPKPIGRPLSVIHLENMLALARMGVVMAPPMPAFYQRPATIDDIVDHIVARVLDQFGLEQPGTSRWPERSGQDKSVAHPRDNAQGGSRAAAV